MTTGRINQVRTCSSGSTTVLRGTQRSPDSFAVLILALWLGAAAKDSSHRAWAVWVGHQQAQHRHPQFGMAGVFSSYSCPAHTATPAHSQHDAAVMRTSRERPKPCCRRDCYTGTTRLQVPGHTRRHPAAVRQGAARLQGSARAPRGCYWLPRQSRPWNQLAAALWCSWSVWQLGQNIEILLKQSLCVSNTMLCNKIVLPLPGLDLR